MTPDVVQVKPLSDYCLEAVFENGERRWFDMKPLLSFPAFSALTCYVRPYLIPGYDFSP
jgi:hypothetical protein